jgi:hypothetical protein
MYDCVHVRSDLRVSANRLTDALPDRIGDLSSLECVPLLSAMLRRVAQASTVPPLSHCRSLVMNNNLLNGSIPSTIGRLSMLTYARSARMSVYLCRCLRVCAPVLLLRLLRVVARTRSLDMCSNRLSGSIPSTLGMLTSLSYVASLLCCRAVS